MGDEDKSLSERVDDTMLTKLQCGGSVNTTSSQTPIKGVGGLRGKRKHL